MRCKVCGKKLNLKAENRYEIREVPKGLRMLVEDAKVYEAFDCPKCGCQNIVNVRKEIIFKDIESEVQNADSDGEVVEEAVG